MRKTHLPTILFIADTDQSCGAYCGDDTKTNHIKTKQNILSDSRGGSEIPNMAESTANTTTSNQNTSTQNSNSNSNSNPVLAPQLPSFSSDNENQEKLVYISGSVCI